MRTISCTSAVVCGKTTASGGSLATQVVVLPCCSRTACEVTSRLPKRAASARRAAARALGSRDSWLTGASACGIGGPFLGHLTLADPGRSFERLRRSRTERGQANQQPFAVKIALRGTLLGLARPRPWYNVSR